MGVAYSVELTPPRKPYSSSPGNRKLIQPVVTNEVMDAAIKVMRPKSFRPSSWLLQPGASSKESHGTICRIKQTFIIVMWCRL